MFNWKPISRQETAYIKAVGMLLILFHNYSHIIKPWAGENEFIFSIQYTSSFLTLIKENPFDLFRLLFAFFGHYGVQLFIFISGYGLFLSYKDKRVKWLSFFKNHLIKLYPAYFLAICLFFLLYPVHYHTLPRPWKIKYGILDLLFVQTFIPGHMYTLVGPWWFFSLIVQLYAIFPVILFLYRRFGIKAVISIGILSWVFTVTLNPLWISFGLNSLYYLFIGRLPVFCLGVIFAWLSEFKIPWWSVWLSLVILLAGNYYKALWPLTMLAVTIFMLVMIRAIVPTIKQSKWISVGLSWIGINSLYIFSVHGFLRWFFVDKATILQNSLITIGLGFAFLCVSLLVAWFIKKFDDKMQPALVRFR